MGFCFGGTVSLEMAWSGADLKGVVSFHGNPTVPAPEEAAGVKAAVLFCHGADDGFVPDVVEAEELPGGGVTGRMVKENRPEVEARIDAAALGYGAGSGTDLATELVRQMAAAASYRANLASIRTEDEVLQSLVSSRG